MTHKSRVISVAFSQDGKYVVSAGGENKFRIWLWRPADLIAEACSFTGMNLSRAEWNLYIGDDLLSYQAICPNQWVEPER